MRSPITTSRSLTHVVQEAHEGAPLRVHGLGKVLEMLDNIFIVEIDLSEHGRWICCDVGRAVKHRQRQAALALLFVVALIAFLSFAGLDTGRPVRGAHNAVLEEQEALLERLQRGSLEVVMAGRLLMVRDQGQLTVLQEPGNGSLKTLAQPHIRLKP